MIVSNVSQLITQQKKAVSDFIQAGRNITIFKKNGIKFDDMQWDLAGFIKAANNATTQTISFKTVRDGKGKDKKQFPEPFNGVAKAYMAQYLEANVGQGLSRTAFMGRIQAFQRLEQQLFEAGKAGDIAALTTEQAVAAFKSTESTTQQRSLGAAVREICSTLNRAGVCPNVSNDIVVAQYVTSDKNRIKSPDQKKKHAKKTLTNDEVFAIADAFHIAGEIGSKRDKLTTSILALMFCAPCRIEEVTILPFDLEVEDGKENSPEDDTLPFDQNVNYRGWFSRYGMRWWPVKGGPPQVKFVVAEMIPVAKKAIERLRVLSKDGRDLAKIISEKDQIPLPPELEHLRQTGEVKSSEVSKIFGLSRSEGIVKRHLVSVRYGVYTFASVEAYWRSQLPKGWPMVSELSGVEYKDCLTTHLLHEYDDGKGPSPCVPTCITPLIIQKDLIGRFITPRNGSKIWRQSVFERLGVKLPNGDYPEINTHQIRHWLNTVAQRANVPQVHIARWSGRKHIAQNQDYDHTDLEDVVQEIMDRSKPEVDPANQVPIIVDDSPDNPDYMEAILRKSIHSTPFGFCTQALRIDPCDRAGACTTCTKLVCIAGNKKHMDAVAADVERRRRAVKNMQEYEQAGGRVNPRTKATMEQQLEHVSQLEKCLSDETLKGQQIKNAEALQHVSFSHSQRRISAMKKLEKQ